jgi:predicted DNA-binding transcriptional regulator YafY
MLLQTHEKMTAQELSKAMEVSPRTIYRDITALNIAGIPVYTDRGPGGGIALVDSYRTTLTGINEDEAKALFMMSIPEALNDLGMSDNLKTALLKMAAALPSHQKTVMSETQQRIYLDSSGWIPSEKPLPHLEIINRAIWGDKLILVIYQGHFNARIECEIEPYGLVSKQNVWYLVGVVEDYIRVIKIKDILEVTVLNENFSREKYFDLVLEWKKWCKANQDHRSVFTAKIMVAPELIQHLKLYLRANTDYQIVETNQNNENGWVEVSIIFENFFQARECILSMGRAAQVVEPEPLKLSIIDFAEQIRDFYMVNS